LSAEARRAQAEARVTEMADRLLANPVIESYRVEVLG
jgi:phosphoribosylformylglycinamidine (FGAM) synthase PurS component